VVKREREGKEKEGKKEHPNHNKTRQQHDSFTSHNGSYLMIQCAATRLLQEGYESVQERGPQAADNGARNVSWSFSHCEDSLLLLLYAFKKDMHLGNKQHAQTWSRRCTMELVFNLLRLSSSFQCAGRGRKSLIA
jgi:hypothetical protein